MNFVLYLIKCNVDKQKLLTCIHIVSNNKKKNILFFFIIITNYAYVHEFHSSKIKEKVFLYMYIIHMYMYSTRLRKCLLQFKFFDYAPY